MVNGDSLSPLAVGRQTASPETQRLSELRIVLLGARSWAGKSSSGNTILGREVFKIGSLIGVVTEQSEKSQGEVAGRQVTVVDTPGWRSGSAQETPERVKQEIVRSVSLCPPGPHALLLTIPVGESFTERERRSVQEHLELLSETVWRHTIVLFTGGDRLGDTTIEQHIERGGEELQRLVEKCGKRYHVLNNSNRGDGTQVTELLDKIEEMLAGHSGQHFTAERNWDERIGQREEEIKLWEVERGEMKLTDTETKREGEERRQKDEETQREVYWEKQDFEGEERERAHLTWTLEERKTEVVLVRKVIVERESQQVLERLEERERETEEELKLRDGQREWEGVDTTEMDGDREEVMEQTSEEMERGRADTTQESEERIREMAWARKEREKREREREAEGRLREMEEMEEWLEERERELVALRQSLVESEDEMDDSSREREPPQRRRRRRRCFCL
ncbi:GTPase IMAP family member 4 [Amia ocellicauda]|uniref:GTPase IMAP family member 4 n=1 Tax=Amia ocellicauda TaxID=2972642 RepID=UPI003464047F